LEVDTLHTEYEDFKKTFKVSLETAQNDEFIDYSPISLF
jgi:hypothetical protein